MSCGKGRASGIVGQLWQALLMQVDSRHQSRCSTHNAYAERCCWEVSCASGSQLLCNNLLGDPPSLLTTGLPSSHSNWGSCPRCILFPPQVGSDAEQKEVHALCIVMPTPGIFIIYFIATVIFFFPYSSICEN